jgi:hypothetical protein
MSDEISAAAPAATTEAAPATAPAPVSDAPAPAAPPAPAPAGYAWPDELKATASAKGWDKFTSADEALQEVTRSYINAEKLLGGPREKLLRLPDEGASPEAWEKVHAALGRPASPDGYKITKPADIPADFPYETAIKPMLDAALPELHKLGQTPAQVQGLTNLITSINVAAMQNAQAEAQQRAEAGEAELRRELGGRYDTDMALADRAAARFGGEEFAGWLKQYGFDKEPAFKRMLINIGRATAEDTTLPGGGGNGMSAATEIDRLIADKTFQAQMNGNDGHEAKKAAMAKWQNLMNRAAVEA